MKNLIALLVVLLTMNSYADGTYVELNTSQFVNVGDFEDENSFSAVVGQRFSDHKIEFEFQVNGFDSTTSSSFQVDADVFTYMINHQYSFYKFGDVSINSILGVGYANPEFYTSQNVRGEDSIVVGKLGVGAEYFVSDNFFLNFDTAVQRFGEVSDNGVTYDLGTPLSAGIGIGFEF